MVSSDETDGFVLTAAGGGAAGGDMFVKVEILKYNSDIHDTVMYPDEE